MTSERPNSLRGSMRLIRRPGLKRLRRPNSDDMVADLQSVLAAHFLRNTRQLGAFLNLASPARLVFVQRQALPWIKVAHL
jgi:hypothetical protein